MKILNFEDIQDLGEFLHEYVNDYDETAAVVMFRDDVVELLNYLEIQYETEWGHIEILEKGYEKEYYLTISSENIVEIYPVFKDNEISLLLADTIFYLGDTSSKIAAANKYIEGYIIEIDDYDCEDCDDCECDECNACSDKDVDELENEVREIWSFIKSRLKS